MLRPEHHAGSYSRLEAMAAPYRNEPHDTAHFGVDPNHPANRYITDLQLAPRDGDGLVRFAADVRILTPQAVHTDRQHQRPARRRVAAEP
jgi:hypothetical protein